MTWFGHSAFRVCGTAIPYHYATVGLIDPNPDAFIAKMKGAETKVLAPERGKAVEM